MRICADVAVEQGAVVWDGSVQCDEHCCCYWCILQPVWWKRSPHGDRSACVTNEYESIMEKWNKHVDLRHTEHEIQTWKQIWLQVFEEVWLVAVPPADSMWVAKASLWDLCWTFSISWSNTSVAPPHLQDVSSAHACEMFQIISTAQTYSVLTWRTGTIIFKPCCQSWNSVVFLMLFSASW